MQGTRRFRTVVVVAPAVVAVLLASLAAHAAPTQAQRCQSAKLMAAASEARAVLLCARPELATGADAGCVATAAQRRDAAFARAESRGGCVTSGDSSDIGAENAALLDAELATLRPGSPAASRCTTAELAAAARLAGKLLQVYARAQRPPGVDNFLRLLDAAHTGFVNAFARATAKGDCLSATAADDAYGIVSLAAARVRGKLVPVCGDGVQASTEACDGSDRGQCPGLCASDCTCAPAMCGDGIVQAGEECDGASCPDTDPGQYGCFAAGSGAQCRCCAQAGPCYIRGFGAVTPVQIPCCSGTCNIPGPEAGPNVTVNCTEPTPGDTCPCWTSASLDAAFPPGYFDQNSRGGIVCNSQGTTTSFGSADTCVLNGPGGQHYTFARGGAAVVSSLCVLVPDLDPANTGVCNGPPTVFGLTTEQTAACVAALQASQAFQSSCP